MAISAVFVVLTGDPVDSCSIRREEWSFAQSKARRLTAIARAMNMRTLRRKWNAGSGAISPSRIGPIIGGNFSFLKETWYRVNPLGDVP
jgi:hypothetical protein